MLEPAKGDFGAADRHTSEASRLSEPWGESMAGEALMAQAGWLLYETGQVEGLNEIVSGLPAQDASSLNEPVWSLAAGLIEAEAGDSRSAIRILRDVFANSRDPQEPAPRPGPHRNTRRRRDGSRPSCRLRGAADRGGGAMAASIADLLAAHPDAFVVAGWPAVFLGSKHRFAGLAHLARPGSRRGRPSTVARAVYDNGEFAVLHTRTRFDLARALIRQPASRPEGIVEMKLVARRAHELGMNGLVA